MILRKEIPYVEAAEFGMPCIYGIAYAKGAAAIFVCYPIPVNICVRFWRYFYHWIKFAPFFRGKEEVSLLKSLMQQVQQVRAENHLFREQIKMLEQKTSDLLVRMEKSPQPRKAKGVQPHLPGGVE